MPRGSRCHSDSDERRSLFGSVFGDHFDDELTGGQRGKQSLAAMFNPGGIFYTPCSGIWQTVWLEAVPARRIEELEMTPDVDAGVLRLKGIARAVDEASGSDEIRWVVFHRVGTRFSYEPLSDGAVGAPRPTLVALGKQVDRHLLEEILAASERRLT